jgi:hypothetical protein
MSQQAQNDFYPSPAEAAMDYAVAVNEEIRDLFAAGADIVQVDEPYIRLVLRKRRTMGSRRSTAHSMASRERQPSISASVMRQSSTSAPVATRFSPSSRTARAAKSRSKPPSPSSTARYSPSSAARKSCSASSTCLT